MHIGEVVITALFGFILLGAVGMFLSIYNGLVALKNNIAKTWSNIDVLLKQRHDELPKLVKTCEGYMQHERAIFDKLSEARAAVAQAHSVAQTAQAEGALTRVLGQLFAVAENYPTLKADQAFLMLQKRISEIENQIADRRELYNDTVNTFNTRIEQIPDMWVAQVLHCQRADLFKVDDEDKRDVEIKFALAG
jgi:LemA protein